MNIATVSSKFAFSKTSSDLIPKFFWLCLMLAMLGPHTSFAQRGFKKGYLVTSTLDTLHGYVENRLDRKSYKFCVFKPSKGSGVVKYPAGQIFGYGYKGYEHYVSQKIYAGTSKETTVYMQVLVVGKISLYEYLGSFWIQKEDEVLTLLESNTIEKKTGSRRSTANINRYYGTLNLAFGDCSEMQSQIADIRLSEESLINAIKTYNRCTGSESKITSKKSHPLIQAKLSIQAGLTKSSLKFTSTDPLKKYLTSTIDPVNAVQFGSLFELSFPRISKRFSFTTGITYFSTEFKHHTEKETIVGETVNDVKITMDHLKIPLGIRVSFPTRKFTPYADAQFTWTKLNNARSYRVNTVEKYGETTIYKTTPFKSESSQTGFQLGVGVSVQVHRHLDALIEIRTENAGAINVNNKDERLESQLTNTHIVLGVRLK